MTKNPLNIKVIHLATDNRGTYSEHHAGGSVPAHNQDRLPYSIRYQGEAYDLPWGTPGAFGPLPHYHGRFRDQNVQPGTSAKTDLEAVAVWLAQKGRRSENTAKRYRREIERLLLWAADQGRCLSDLGQEDFLRYEKFLTKPEPYGQWVMRQRFDRGDRHWRPFLATKANPTAGLTPQGRYESLAICRGAIHKLQKMNWLVPTEILGDITPPPRRAPETIEPNALTKVQIKAVKQAIKSIENPLERLRMHWLTELFITIGPRVSEVVDGRMADIELKIADDRSLWVIKLTGKGRRVRSVPLPAPVMKSLGEFRVAIGLPRLPGSAGIDLNFPLAPKMGQRISKMTEHDMASAKAMTANGIYRRYQTIFAVAAETLSQSGFTVEAEKLMEATTHDLRHTALKWLADTTNGDMRLVQKMAGHGSITTSAIYARSGLTELEEALMHLTEGREENS